MPYNDNFVIRPHSPLTLEQKRWLDDKYPAWVAAKYFNVLDVLMQNYFEWWLVDFPQSQYQDYTADCIKAAMADYLRGIESRKLAELEEWRRQHRLKWERIQGNTRE